MALGWVGLNGRNQIGDGEHELEQSSWSTDWMERGRRSRTGAEAAEGRGQKRGQGRAPERVVSGERADGDGKSCPARLALPEVAFRGGRRWEELGGTKPRRRRGTARRASRAGRGVAIEY